MKKYLIILTTLILLISCNKEEIITHDTPKESHKEIETRSNNSAETILGSQKSNPYEISNMQNAYNTLYGAGLNNLSPTHKYIRFQPQDYKELRTLYSSRLPLFDYPLDYEVLNEGNYYKDPNLAPNQPPYLYTTVEVGQTLPNIQHTVLQNLYVPPNDAQLSMKAFELIGIPAQDASYVINESNSLIEISSGDGDGEYPGPGWTPPGTGGPTNGGEEDPLIRPAQCFWEVATKEVPKFV